MAVDPPEIAGADLGADWRDFVSWAASRSETLVAESAVQRDEIAGLEARLTQLASEVTNAMGQMGLAGEGTPHAETVAAAIGDCRQQLERIRHDLEMKAEAERGLEHATARAAVAKSLAQHLQANRFEAWLMEEALHGLTAGANILLGQLSDGAYSLQLDQRDFSVIDHRNADETRPVKTLSGGETFLVSLALALALAEQIGVMAGGGNARLESIFLDEGFGTLDGETLDLVASVIQELGASGRTVGIVTHVAELAEMVPTRFEVTRSAAGSQVERIDA
jgi:exonuclease SbcC